MKIVFLDSYTTNPGDLSFEMFNDFGEFESYEFSTFDEAIERGMDCDIIVSNKFKIDEDLLSHWPKCKMIAVAATGYNNIDIAACDEKNILVTNVKGYSTNSVAQITFAGILNVFNKVQKYNNDVANGRWGNNRDFSFYDHSIKELNGKILGIYGTGNIGMKVAEIGNAFGMSVIAVSKHPIEIPSYIECVTQDHLFSYSDIISLNVPLNSSTYEMINMTAMSKFKENGILVNTSRGQLINETELSEYLKCHPNYSAVLDVLCNEPPLSDNPLVGLDNCYITPHQAWASIEARQKLITGLYDNINAFVKGEPISVVN
jgi:glycerate dehydrogenase